MADFCWQCCDKVLGIPSEKNDLRGLCKEGEVASAICEGCGFVFVDHLGKCQGGDGCMEGHAP